MKLRSIYLGTLPLMAVAMTACSSNEELARPVSESDAINFSVVSNNMTRAANSYCNSNKPSSFKVTAYYNISENGTSRTVNYYNGDIDELTSTDNGATYPATKVRYWPENGENLSFYACVDDGGTFTKPDELSEAPSPFVPQFKDFTVNNTVADQTDLMYAVAANVNAKSHDGKVPLNFRHALAQICFTAQNNSAYQDIKIKSIEVGGVSGKGTFKFPTESSNYGAYDHEESSLPEEGTYSCSWTDLSETSSYKLDLSGSPVSLGASDAETGIGEKKYISTPGAPDASSTSHANADFAKAMNLIPQYIQEGAYFKISMDVLLPGATAYTTPEPITIPIKRQYWNEGYRYVYNLIWSGDKVIYDVNFSDYNENTPSDEDAGIAYKSVLMREASGATPALYFADRNIGAEKPGDSGRYFYWGDIEGYELQLGEDTYHTLNNYDYDADKNPNAGKSDRVDFQSMMDNTEIKDRFQLKAEYDAAVQLWGGKWRMPTYDDFKWLEDNCIWTWIDASEGKLSGYNIYSPFTNNSIFLPAAGDIDGDVYENYPYQSDFSGFYFTSTWGVHPNNWEGHAVFWMHEPSVVTTSDDDTLFADEQYLGTIRPVHN